MIKRVRAANFNLTEEAVVWDEIADLIQKNIEISWIYKKRFVRTEIQQKVKDIIDYSEIPEGHVLHILLFGGVGSGKTTCAISQVMDILLAFPGANCLGVRRTYGEIEDALWKDFGIFCEKYGISFTTNKARYVMRFPNGSVARFRSAEKTAKGKSDKANSLGGTAYSVVVLDEADEIPREYADTIPGRMRETAGVKRKVIIYICNPPSKDHWLYEKFFDDPEYDPYDPRSPYRVCQMNPEHNIEHTGEAYLAIVEQAYKHNPALYERMRKGEFGSAVKGLPIFSSVFDENVHVSPTNIREGWNKNYPLYRCWDFGWRRPACVIFQDDRDRGQLRVLYEALGNKTMLERFVEDQLDIQGQEDYFPGAKYIDICDIAGNQMSDKHELTSIQILQSYGLKPKYRRTTISYGLSIMSQQLRRSIPHRLKPVPAVILDPRCVNLKDGFKMGYCADEGFALSGESNQQEIKVNKDGFYEHLMDALRYGFVFARKLNVSVRRNDPRETEWLPYDVDERHQHTAATEKRKPERWGRALPGRRGRKPPMWGGSYNFK
jgi:PBSX family phage terminase large subunit